MRLRPTVKPLPENDGSLANLGETLARLMLRQANNVGRLRHNKGEQGLKLLLKWKQHIVRQGGMIPTRGGLAHEQLRGSSSGEGGVMASMPTGKQGFEALHIELDLNASN